jgi:hypothetical protein
MRSGRMDGVGVGHCNKCNVLTALDLHRTDTERRYCWVISLERLSFTEGRSGRLPPRLHCH